VTVLCVLLAGWFGFAVVYPVVVAERGVTLRVEAPGWDGGP
jgi:hypothetical protein